MKRSQINITIKKTEQLLKDNQIILSPNFYGTPDEWRQKGPECDAIRDNQLGCGVTNFGCHDFAKTGLTALTFRNGNQKNPAYSRPL